MSLIGRLLKANPSAQVSDMLTGYFVIPSAKGVFVDTSNRGIFGGGITTYPSYTNVIDYINIPTTGNAVNFGNLTTGRWGLGACASSTRGCFSGGQTGESLGTLSNIIDFVNFASTGNATDFGDLTQGRYVIMNGSGSSTRGLFFGGLDTANNYESSIDYITIATEGNALNFGNMTVSAYGVASCSSPTRAVSSGGWTGSVRENTMGYVTIATTGNSTDFGDLTQGRYYLGGCSNSTRGLFMGGEYVASTSSNVIDYITIATTGNATDFGDLTTAREAAMAVSSPTRGVFAGGSDAGARFNIIDYFTIDTTGNAIDFGDLTGTKSHLGSSSNGHGGLS